ncbi:MAG: 50S ribosomal protein L21 [Ignavibacteria bacterium]|nr:50S ribosomal protein L21 [Ignavibacteria bacterium]
MHAVVEIAGKQVRLTSKDRVNVPLLKAKPGSKVTFDRVLLLHDKDSVTVGTPVVKGASVEAKVVADRKAEKVIVFKKKRRKGYKVRRGHRQQYTEIEITNILKK